MRFDDTGTTTGHLEVYKIYKDGTEELHYSEKNVITSGMGLTLAYAFAAEPNADVSSFQANWMQIGTGASTVAIRTNPTVQVSGRADLLSSVPRIQYGSENTIGLTTSSMSYMTSSDTTSKSAFVRVPTAFVHRVSDRKVMWRLVLNDSACNIPNDAVHGGALNEVAIFSNNPMEVNPPVLKMIAYRAFANIIKTNEFTLDFRWTIEF
tara:strand:+ start:2462 stop:3085 length:624 start_codon:yes stop_codon:yes gene_type:complete